jgi:hypothetical protein
MTMAEIEIDSFFDDGPNYLQRWRRRLQRKIKDANDGDVIIVRSGLQKGIATAMLTRTDKKIKVVKR